MPAAASASLRRSAEAHGPAPAAAANSGTAFFKRPLNRQTLAVSVGPHSHPLLRGSNDVSWPPPAAVPSSALAATLAVTVVTDAPEAVDNSKTAANRHHLTDENGDISLDFIGCVTGVRGTVLARLECAN